jgi:hypothetical protein
MNAYYIGWYIRSFHVGRTQYLVPILHRQWRVCRTALADQIASVDQCIECAGWNREVEFRGVRYDSMIALVL